MNLSIGVLVLCWGYFLASLAGTVLWIIKWSGSANQGMAAWTFAPLTAGCLVTMGLVAAVWCHHSWASRMLGITGWMFLVGAVLWLAVSLIGLGFGAAVEPWLTRSLIQSTRIQVGLLAAWGFGLLILRRLIATR